MPLVTGRAKHAALPVAEPDAPVRRRGTLGRSAPSPQPNLSPRVGLLPLTSQPRSSLFSAPAGCARRVCGDLGKHLSSPIQAVVGPRVSWRRVRLPHWPASRTVRGNPAENPRARRRNPPCIHQRWLDGFIDAVSSWPLESARSGGRVLGLPLLSPEP